MRDYARLFDDKKPIEKKGVKLFHGIDWWVKFLFDKISKSIFIVVLLLLALIVNALWKTIDNKNYFPINDIVISGNIAITKKENILNQLQEAIKDENFITTNLDSVSNQLSELAWVESATIERSFPSKLEITVTERVAKYRWGEEELIDEFGNRFVNNNKDAFKHLPMIKGVDGHELSVINAFEEFQRHLHGVNTKINPKKLIQNKFLSWELHLEGNVVVKFGRDEYSNRLARFFAVIRANKLPELNEITSMDFRYPNGFAIVWKTEFIKSNNEEELISVGRTKA